MQLRKTSCAIAAAGLVAAGAALGAVVPDTLTPTDASPTVTMVASASPLRSLSDKQPIPMMTAPNYRAIVEQNASTVVGITTIGETKAPQMQNPFGENSPFSQFFRGQPGMSPQGRVPTRGLGSGFIVSENGLILTNAHVVADATKVTVKLSDNHEYEAKVLGSDEATDIAVIQIDAKNLPTVRTGNPEALGVGDYVLAIGAPYGLEQSATAGIVSAKARSLPNDAFVPFIQTDVAVNPGNSGGPLFDASGAVVGINSQIYSNTGGYEGVSFAIPIDVAMHISDQLVKHGKVEHALLGVSVQGVNQSLAQSFGLKEPAGALVAKVESDSAAEKAGLQAGDVLLSYNGVPIRAAGDLSSRVGLASPGDKAELEVWRDGKTKTVVARLGALSEVASADGNGGSADDARLGLAVRPLSPEEQRASGLLAGMLVEEASGPAAEAGIQRGDVVLSIDGEEVSSAEQMRKIVGKHDDRVALLIQRGQVRIFVPVGLG